MLSSYLSQIGFDVMRCAGIAFASLGIGWPLGTKLPRTKWAAVVLLAPLLTPALLVSYAYAPLALQFTGQPNLLVFAYSCLLGLKLACIVALVRWAFPASIEREALFCARLIQPRTARERIVFSVRTLGATPWLTLVLTFLVAFTDFELASLLNVKTWTVQLFDAHAGGLELGSSLQRVAIPLALEIVLVTTVLSRARRAPTRSSPPAIITAKNHTAWSLCVTVLVALVAALIPAGIVVFQSLKALGMVALTGLMIEEILASLAFAIAGVGLAWLVAGITVPRRFRELLLVPGLLGGLVLSLLVVALFQTPLLRFGYNTPMPLILALGLLFTPIAYLLKGLLRAHEPREALRLARMAGVGILLWDLTLSRRVAAIGLLFLLAYFEFTASALLSPIGFTPVFVRLHNLSHYGQTPTLSLMLLTATLAPAALLALTLALGRLYARRDAR